jgi:hypothetical protein
LSQPGVRRSPDQPKPIGGSGLVEVRSLATAQDSAPVVVTVKPGGRSGRQQQSALRRCYRWWGTDFAGAGM